MWPTPGKRCSAIRPLRPSAWWAGVMRSSIPNTILVGALGAARRLANVERLSAAGENSLGEPPLLGCERPLPALAQRGPDERGTQRGGVDDQHMQPRREGGLGVGLQEAVEEGAVGLLAESGRRDQHQRQRLDRRLVRDRQRRRRAPSEWPTRCASCAPSSIMTARAASTSASKLASLPSGERPWPGRSIASAGRVSGRRRCSGRQPLRSAPKPCRNTIGAPAPRCSHEPMDVRRRPRGSVGAARCRAAGCARAGLTRSRPRAASRARARSVERRASRAAERLIRRQEGRPIGRPSLDRLSRHSLPAGEAALRR